MTNPQSQALTEFDQIVELPEAERAAALAALDPLVAAAVAELLRADAASSGMLDRGIQAFATELVGTEEGASSAGMLQAGDTIGGFALQRLLGRGGMGEVWLALRKDSSDADGFVQQVALKVLKRGMDSDSVSARFMQERKILAELNHPHFARFIDGGISADGRLYFAMEYVDGVNLVEHASAKNLPVRERVRLLAEICEAVAYAQNHLVVHRDLKPSNILVDGSGEVRVLDFGIAKLLGERAPTDTLTHTGVHALSPAYAAPEQVLGQQISTATDVYALGVILFELVTGTLPHRRQLVSFEALIAQINSEQTPVPSQTLRRMVNTGSTSSLHSARVSREVSGDLDTIILTAMQREPARRYASAAALADDLRRWLAGKPIAAQPDSRSYRIKKFALRNRLMVGSVSTVLLALVAGLALALWQAGVAREQARLAQAQTLRAERVKDFLISLFAETEGVGRVGVQRSPLDLVSAGIASADTELADDVELRDGVIGDLLDIQVNLGAWQIAAPKIDEVLTFRRARFGDLDLRVAEILASKINVYFRGGRYTDAEPMIAQALEINRRLRGEQHIDVANMQNRLVRVRISQGRFQEALALMQLVAKKFELHWGATHQRYGLVLSNLATIQIRLRDFDAAQDSLNRSLKILEQVHGSSHASLLFPLTTLGDLQRNLGLNKQALQTYQRSSQITQANLGEDHASFAVSLNRIGDMHRRLRDFEQARINLQKALNLEQALQSTGLGDTYARLGDLSVDQSQPEAAIAWFQKAHEFQLKTQGEKSLNTWSRLASVAAVLTELERFEQARAVLNTAITKTQALGNDSAREVVLLRAQLALLERNAKNYPLAIELLTQSQSQMSALTTPDDPKLQIIAVHLAATLALTGTAENRVIAKAQLDRIDPNLSELPPIARATEALAKALISDSKETQKAHLDRLANLLETIGSDGLWLRKMREEVERNSRLNG